MLRWTVIFLVIALIAASFGVSGIAASAAGLSQIVTLFLILFALSLIAGLLGVRAPRF